jgi:hypothetical protein
MIFAFHDECGHQTLQSLLCVFLQITFIDDLNMPQKSQFGFIPPLELLKLWVDNGFW